MNGNQRITPSRDNCVYTSCYCEENVWKLCEFIQKERSSLLEEVFVVFISNEHRTVPLWKQKAGHGDQPVIWDYHVVLLQLSRSGHTLVYDLDSVLPFPCCLQLYAAQAFRSDRGVKPAFWRKLRVIPADNFLQNFASDRSHMKDSDGAWRMPPPPYPPIQTTESQMNLDQFISMESGVGWGRVFSLDGFLQHYSSSSSLPQTV